MLVLEYTAEVEVWVAACFIALGHHRFLEPRNGFVPFPLLDQIGADIVVRVAKIGVDLDGALTVCNRVVVIGDERIGPAAKGVSLGGGEGDNGLSVKLQSSRVVAVGLRFVGLTKILAGDDTWVRIGHESPEGELDEILLENGSNVMGNADGARVAGRDIINRRAANPTSVDFGSVFEAIS